MSDSIHLDFILEAKSFNKSYDYKLSTTVKEILEKFLKDTNSVMNYSTEAITFICNTSVLNKKGNLDKPLSKVITKSVIRTGNAKIKIYETIDIIGGKLNINK